MRVAALLLEHRRPAWVVAALLTVLLGYAATSLSFDFSPQNVYAGDGDDLAFCEAFHDTFGHPDAVLAVLLEAPRGASVVSVASLTWMQEVGRDVADLPLVIGVDSLAGLHAPRLGGPEGWTLAPILTDVAPTASDVERVKRLVARLPLVEGLLVSKDRRHAALLVTLNERARAVGIARPLLARITRIVDEHAPPPGYRIDLSGLPAIRTGIATDLEHETIRTLPIAVLLFTVVMFLAYRCVAGTLLPLLAVGLGMVWAGGALAWIGVPLNIFSNILPVTLTVIGFANCVHIVNRYAEECAHTPDDRPAALRRTMSHMIPACLLTYATTAIGFLSLTTARYRLLQELGWETALGLAMLYVSTMLVLGTLLSRFPPPRPAPRENARRGWAAPLGHLGHFVTARPWLIVSGGLAVIVISLVSARDLRVDNHVLDAYDPEQPIRRTLQMMEDHLGGVLTIDVALRGDQPGAFQRPSVYADVERFARRTRTRAPVLSVLSYVDLQAALSLRPADAAAPPTVAALQAAHTVGRRLGDRLHYGAFLSPDDRQARIVIRVRDVGSQRLLVLLRDLETDLAATSLAKAGVHTRLTSDGCLFARSIDGFTRDLVVSLLGAAVIIFTIIAVFFRSLGLGLLSVVPNLAPLVIVLGYMRLRGYDLDVSKATVFAIGLGVAVDDTIHFLTRLREERRHATTTQAAIRHTIRSAGRAMILSTTLIVVGFAFLHTSAFVLSRRFAELTGVTMVAALLGDLFFLPACLTLADRLRLRRTT